MAGGEECPHGMTRGDHHRTGKATAPRHLPVSRDPVLARAAAVATARRGKGGEEDMGRRRLRETNGPAPDKAKAGEDAVLLPSHLSSDLAPGRTAEVGLRIVAEAWECPALAAEAQGARRCSKEALLSNQAAMEGPVL
jgi:hypothetical protein